MVPYKLTKNNIAALIPNNRLLLTLPYILKPFNTEHECTRTKVDLLLESHDKVLRNATNTQENTYSYSTLVILKINRVQNNKTNYCRKNTKSYCFYTNTPTRARRVCDNK